MIAALVMAPLLAPLPVPRPWPMVYETPPAQTAPPPPEARPQTGDAP